MKGKSKAVAYCGVLVCAALVLSVVEGFLPAAAIPLPGVKLGLANIVILFTLYKFGIAPAAAVLFAKCVLSSIFGGGITALAFSLSGGFLSLIVMWLLKKVSNRILSVYGVSIGGAAAHGIGQIIASGIMLGTTTIIYYLPALLLSGIFTGTLTGAIVSLLLKKFK